MWQKLFFCFSLLNELCKVNNVISSLKTSLFLYKYNNWIKKLELDKFSFTMKGIPTILLCVVVAATARELPQTVTAEDLSLAIPDDDVVDKVRLISFL